MFFLNINFPTKFLLINQVLVFDNQSVFLQFCFDRGFKFGGVVHSPGQQSVCLQTLAQEAGFIWIYNNGFEFSRSNESSE